MNAGRFARVRRAGAALGPGALVASALIALAGAIRVHAGVPWVSVDTGRLAHTYPVIAVAVAFAFLLLGPLLWRLLAVAGLTRWWGAAAAPALAAFLLLHALDPGVRLLPHLVPPQLVALAATVAHAWHARREGGATG